MNILLIEDDKETLSFLTKAFRAEGFIVDTAEDGKTGLQKATLNKYAVIVLDNNLPFKTGREVCAEIRKNNTDTRIIMLSVVSDTDAKVDMLNCGTDDYLTKPYSFDELLARVNAVLRRPEKLKDAILEVGSIPRGIP